VLARTDNLSTEGLGDFITSSGIYHTSQDLTTFRSPRLSPAALTANPLVVDPESETLSPFVNKSQALGGSADSLVAPTSRAGLLRA
jgi:hypothetical protein